MPKIDRRDFIKLIGAGGVGAGAGFLLGESIKHPVEHLIPYPVPPEEYSPGIVTWYHSVCGMCPAGCGISVRIREGRAKKIEGNPLHPVSQGALCALGQAGLQALYNPDRITAPSRLGGERGSGAFVEVTWDEALAAVAQRLGPLRASGRGGRVWMLSSGQRGHRGRLQREFLAALGSDRLVRYDFAHPQTLYAANRRFFGESVLPYYDLKNADYLLSFGADFLGTWISPVLHSLGYGHGRQGRLDKRSRLVQVEPRLSLTGASADEWIPAHPGTEGVLALGLARHIVAAGYGGPDADAWRAALATYTPARVAEQTGVPAATIERLADEFAHHERALAIGGGAAASHRNGVDALVAVNALNYLAGNIGQPGGVVFNPAPPAGEAPGQEGYRGVLDLIEAANRGLVEVLIVDGANPLYSLPAAAGFDDALAKIPLVVSLGSFMDETTARADLILPGHTYLESWGDDFPEPGVGFPVGAVAQPVVSPLYNTRAAGDTLLSLARLSGADDLKWASLEERVKDGWREIHARGDFSGDPEVQDFDAFWDALLQSGVWGETAHRDHTGFGVERAAIERIGVAPPEFSGAADAYPFVLHPYLSQTFNDGRGANLPWMQELADPLTAVVYGCWVEVNPETAKKLGVEEGDLVEVASVHGSLELPVYVYPAIMPGVVAIPIGQGHTEYGRYAKGRGANPIRILSPEMEPESGALAWGATRVQLTRTGRRAKLTHTGGESRQLGRNIIQTTGGHDAGHAGGPTIPIKVVTS